MSSSARPSIRLGSRTGGRQAPRREALLSLRFGWRELAAAVLAAAYLGAAAYLVGHLGLASSEAVARTARVAVLWEAPDLTMFAFGFDRPPLLSLLTAPFAAFEGLRANGMAAALGTAAGSAISLPIAAKVARDAGMIPWARALFVLAFVTNPVLVYAGIFGLPEMIYASLVLLSIVEYTRWVQDRTVASVITSGVALGLAFLVRYNVLLVAVVMAWGYWYTARGKGRRGEDAHAAQANTLAFLVPIIFVAGLWALIAWFPRGYPLDFVHLARALTALGDDDPAILARMADLRGDPVAVAGWVGWWTLLIAPASILAVLGLAASAFQSKHRERTVLAVLAASLLLPEVVALLGGWGQARIPHLFVAVVPAFAVVAYRERLLTRGVPPSVLEGPRRRAQVALSAGLLAVSLASAVAVWQMPETDAPAPALADSVRTGLVPAPFTQGEREMAAYLREHAGTGDVVVDVNRHAAVMLLADDLALFQTEANRAQEATLYEPFGVARFVLARRPVAGQGPGRIERAHPLVFEAGSGAFTLEFESGDYRLYAVTGPAVPSFAEDN